MGDWFRRFHTFIIRLVLGDNEVGPFKPDKGLDPTVEAYGQCIAVLLASTQTYLEQRIESLPAGSAERLAAEQCQTKVVGLEKAFEDSSQPEAERFKSYVKIDAQLIAIIPDDFLVARRWILLDRMRRVAPQKALIEYEGSLPPSMDKAKRDLAKEIRADLLSLSTYMQQLYILNAQREQTLASFKWWLLSRVLVIVGIIAAIFWLATTVTPAWLSARPWSMPWMPTALILVFLTGMVGAVVSIIRKFQDIGGQNILVSDPFNELVSLNYSRESVAASIVVGGVFALVAYLAVVSGATDALGLNVRFVPSLTANRIIVEEKSESKANKSPAGEQKSQLLKDGSYVEQAPDEVPEGIAKLSGALGFFYGADILRMMLLAFIAGFAERLVPDSIDRLARKEKSVKESAN